MEYKVTLDDMEASKAMRETIEAQYRFIKSLESQNKVLVAMLEKVVRFKLLQGRLETLRQEARAALAAARGGELSKEPRKEGRDG